MNVTILADASHCPETKAGGYGYWIASARGKKGGSGALKGSISSSTLAEMMAIANAIHHAIKFGLVQAQDVLLVQTDCESAIFAFSKKRKGSEEEKKVVEYVLRVVRLLSLAIEYKHVKGHTNSSKARFAANNACDRAARKAMRRARDKIRLEQLKQILEKGKQNEAIPRPAEKSPGRRKLAAQPDGDSNKEDCRGNAGVRLKRRVSGGHNKETGV